MASRKKLTRCPGRMSPALRGVPDHRAAVSRQRFAKIPYLIGPLGRFPPYYERRSIKYGKRPCGQKYHGSASLPGTAGFDRLFRYWR
jgi:hypothetical protein